MFLRERFEEILNNRPVVFKEGPVKVAYITFAFNNPTLLGLLNKRGALYKNADYNKF